MMTDPDSTTCSQLPIPSSCIRTCNALGWAFHFVLKQMWQTSFAGVTLIMVVSLPSRAWSLAIPIAPSFSSLTLSWICMPAHCTYLSLLSSYLSVCPAQQMPPASVQTSSRLHQEDHRKVHESMQKKVLPKLWTSKTWEPSSEEAKQQDCGLHKVGKVQQRWDFPFLNNKRKSGVSLIITIMAGKKSAAMPRE